MLDEIQEDWDEIELNQDARLIDPEQAQLAASEVKPIQLPDPRIVFVVHGRNIGRRDALFRFLRSIGLKPLEWSQALMSTGRTSPYIGEVLDAAFAKAQAVVVLMTQWHREGDFDILVGETPMET